MLASGRFDVSFDSAPQIDQYGNLNITAIGEYKRPKVRLVGCLAQPDHFAFVKRPIIVTDLKKRTFVEKVDFITSVGYLNGGNSRVEAGLLPTGRGRSSRKSASSTLTTSRRRCRSSPCIRA